MNLLEKLAEAARRQSDEADLPSWLLADILEIAGNPSRHSGQDGLIEVLLHQVEDFDSYAGTGCFGSSVSAATIQATLKRISGDEPPSS